MRKKARVLMYAAKTLIFYNKLFRARRERNLKFRGNNSGVNLEEINRLGGKIDLRGCFDERNWQTALCVLFHI